MNDNSDVRSTVGVETVFVIPVGPRCQSEFVADTIESIRYFAPQSRIIVIDDSQRRTGADLAERYGLTSLDARVHGLYGSLYLNLSDAFREALSRPFKVLVRLDTDALVAGSDFESKALEAFAANERLGSLGSFRVGYNREGERDRGWAKRQLLRSLAMRTLTKPRQALMVSRLMFHARKHGYKLGDGIMGGAAIYRSEAVASLDAADLLGRVELAETGLHEDYIFGLCLFSIGWQLGEFGDRYDNLPMGVDWKGLPASPAELIERGKSIIHSTKSFETMDERTIRDAFRAART